MRGAIIKQPRHSFSYVKNTPFPASGSWLFMTGILAGHFLDLTMQTIAIY